MLSLVSYSYIPLPSRALKKKGQMQGVLYLRKRSLEMSRRPITTVMTIQARCERPVRERVRY